MFLLCTAVVCMDRSVLGHEKQKPWSTGRGQQDLPPPGRTRNFLLVTNSSMYVEVLFFACCELNLHCFYASACATRTIGHYLFCMVYATGTYFPRPSTAAVC